MNDRTNKYKIITLRLNQNVGLMSLVSTIGHQSSRWWANGILISRKSNMTWNNRDKDSGLVEFFWLFRQRGFPNNYFTRILPPWQSGLNFLIYSKFRKKTSVVIVFFRFQSLDIEFYFHLKPMLSSTEHTMQWSY